MKKRLCFLLFILSVIGGSVQADIFPENDPRVQKVYGEHQAEMIWILNGAWTSCAKVLLEALSHVDEEGLWPEDYQPILDAINNQNIETPEDQRKADQLLTLAALNYISDMKGERLKPNSINRMIHVKEVVIDEAELLKKYISIQDQCAWIHNLAPSTTEYKYLKQTLAQYRQKQADGGWTQLPKGTKLEKGDSGPLVETLRAQLDAQRSMSSEGQGSDLFDENLEQVVKEYQSFHGLEVDGVVGPNTLATLNTPVEEWIRDIIVSMEEQRWLPSPLPNRYILVNIPGYYLRAVSHGETNFFMPIITGKEYTKTPVFNAKMTQVVFNPSWYVPNSIMGEILPKMQKSPSSYAGKGYYMSNGRIIQRPGNANALGKIKFYIENPYGIYLHGTPSAHLFDKATRAYSHGCIRVQDTYKLAQFVLNDPDKWTLSRVRDGASGTRTNKVSLPTPLPTFVTYSTVFEGENDQMHFVKDTYGFDAAIWKALEKTRRNY